MRRPFSTKARLEADGQPVVTATGETTSVLFQHENLIGGALEVGDPVRAREAAFDLLARCPPSG